MELGQPSTKAIEKTPQQVDTQLPQTVKLIFHNTVSLEYKVLLLII